MSWGEWAPDDVEVTGGPVVRWYNQREQGALDDIPPQFNGVWLTFYAPTGSASDGISPDTVVDSRPDSTTMTAGDVQTGGPCLTPLSWDNETVLLYGVPFDEPEPDTAKEWAQVVYTAWQLMAQTGKSQLTQVEAVPRDRAGRKCDRRDGITKNSTVRIINVHSAHRPSSAATEQDAASSTGRHAPQWSCRWPIRPDRRNMCMNPRAHADGTCETPGPHRARPHQGPRRGVL